MQARTITDCVEGSISMREAARVLDCHLSTVWRYWNPGVRGIRLETFLVGVKRKTTRAAIEKFLVALNGAEA